MNQLKDTALSLLTGICRDAVLDDEGDQQWMFNATLASVILGATGAEIAAALEAGLEQR